MKERLTNLMLSPSKGKADSASQGSVKADSVSMGSNKTDSVSVTSNKTDSVSLGSNKTDSTSQESEETPAVKTPAMTESSTNLVEYNCPEVEKIQIQNSFKKKSGSSLSGRLKSKKSSDGTGDSAEGTQIKKELNIEQPIRTESEEGPVVGEASELSTTNNVDHSLQPGCESGSKADEDFILKKKEIPAECTTVNLTDRSPNPSDISAVGDSSLIRTPARDMSEMVSSIRDAELSLPDQCSVQEDSNLDLFEDTAVNGASLFLLWTYFLHSIIIISFDQGILQPSQSHDQNVFKRSYRNYSITVLVNFQDYFS